MQALKKLQDESGRYAADEEKLFINTFAPVLCAYTEWVLRKASDSGIGTIYFLSRDGYMLLEAAKRLKDTICPDMQLRYLNVSRFSLRSAQYYDSGKNCLDTICSGGMNITFKKLMKRALLTDDECIKIASCIGMSKRMDEALDYKMILKIKEDLKEVSEFFDMVKEHTKQPHENVCGYLLQEGLMDDTKKGIVDSGWIGTVQNSLMYLIRKPRTLHGYYFGLYETPVKTEPDTEPVSEYDAYYIKPRGRSGDNMRNLKRKKDFSICLFESVCSSPEGMTVGYEKNADGKYIPVTDMDQNPNAGHINRFSKIMKEYASGYFSEITSGAYSYDEDEDLDMVNGIMSSLMGDPSSEEASVLGQLMFCDDVLESELKSVAGKITKEDIRKLTFIRRLMGKTGICKDITPMSGWFEGSIALVTDENDIREKKIRKRAIKNEHAMRVLTEIRKAL